MSNFGQALGLVITVLGIAGLVSGAYAVIRTNASQSTIRVLQDDNHALRGRVETLEASDQECKKQLEHVQAQNKLLSELVTGAPAIAEVKGAVETMSKDMQHGFDLLAQAVGRAVDAMGKKGP